MRALLARDLCEPAPARARSTLYACCSLHLRALRTLIDFYACYSLHLRALRTRIEIYASTLPLELAPFSTRMRVAFHIYAHCVGARDLCVLLSRSMRIIQSLMRTRTIVNAYTIARMK